MKKETAKWLVWLIAAFSWYLGALGTTGAVSMICLIVAVSACIGLVVLEGGESTVTLSVVKDKQKAVA